MSERDVFESAAARWRERGVKVNPPATRADVLHAFAALGHPVSEDVVRLYTLLDGFADYDVDPFWWLWPLSRILEENQANAPYVLFADYMINSYQYAFVYNDAHTSSIFIWDGVELRDLMAGNVEEFLEKYCRAPEEIWLW